MAHVEAVNAAVGSALRLLQVHAASPAEIAKVRALQAEKQAAANVILRREETAATRSLANTAKILASNPTLMRLKELEALRELAEQVDSVTLYAGVDPATLPSLSS